MEFSPQLAAYVSQLERGIRALVPAAETRPSRLHTAMRYSLEAGGKRIRPVLLLAAADLFDAPLDTALPAAVAIECVHTYSLIHDDLPCMDDDDLRRGRPTAHKQFDEATALLAGDALLTHGFALLANSYPAQTSQMLVRELSSAAGSEHLIGGQMEDLLAEKKTDATSGELEFIHLNKTAALIESALVMGGIIGGAGDQALTELRAAGRGLGLAFQIIDDILDATAETSTLGKTAGKDARVGKTTFVSLHGLDRAQILADEQTDRAINAFARVAVNTTFLQELTKEMLSRRR